jgi:broad specificity phosphatase PhoE
MAAIYLVRHGQASFGSSDYDQLSVTGLRQAQLGGRYLQFAAGQVSRLICGSLTRQRDTAREIAKCLCAGSGDTLPVTVDERFNELDVDSLFQCVGSQLDGADCGITDLITAAKHSSYAYKKLLKRVFVAWQTHRNLPPSVETWSQFCSRVDSAIADIRSGSARGKSVVVVTSGGVIANVVRMILDLPPDATYSLFEMMMNCSVTRLLYNSTRISLSSFNDCSYLWADENGRGDLQLFTYI